MLVSNRGSFALPPGFPAARYEVQALIGEGSRKRVFFAQDTHLERAVAVSFIKTTGFDPLVLDRARRQACEVGRLGDHPNIVTTYDIGEANGQLYIITQFLAGGDVKRLLDASEGHRLPIGRAVEIAQQVCAALEHSHARGVVHGEVRLDNVWLTESGVACLGDFGFALGCERTRLNSEGTVVGTFAYMAPEQALGRTPEPLSDLYSVGAMLYEMVTGRPPFVGDDPIAVVSQHLNAPLVAPSWQNPDVPSDLEALILKLLAKTSTHRPFDASTARAALVAIERTPSRQVGQDGYGDNSIGRLAGGVFVGRGQEMEDLRADVVETLTGRGRLVLVGGEPGIGKTSMAQEVTTYARLAGLQVLWGRCDETGGAPPYWPWIQVIRSYVHDVSAADVASVMGSDAAVIAQIVPEAGQDLAPSSLRPPVEPAQARFALFDSIATFLRNAGKRRPLLLVMDDVHVADMPSLLLLQFLTRQIADMGAMVVAAYRDVEVGRQHPLFQVLGDLVREPVTRRVVLRGLTESDVGRYIELSTGTAQRELAAAVFRETEGNPFFVGEIVRLLVAQGNLETASAGGPWRSELPQGVREAIGRRLDRLSPECNRILTLGSVVGREFGINVLERASDTPREKILQGLEEALAARVIAEAPGSPGHYCFGHSLIRETLYGELSTNRRVQFHRRIGEVLETLYRLQPESHLAELAHHFFEAAQGGDPDKAVEYAMRAGNRAAEQMAHEEAARYYEMGLQVLEGTDPGSGTRVVDLLLALSEARWRAGKVDEAKEASLGAIDIARTVGATEQFARAALAVAGRLPAFNVARPDSTVIALLEEALQKLGDGESRTTALVMARLAEEQTLAESHERRRSLSRRAIEIARHVGDPTLLASVLRSSFFAHWDPLGLEQRLAVSDEIIRLAEQVRDRGLALEGHIFRLLGWIEVGDAQEVQGELEFCKHRAEELRQPYHQFVVATLRVGWAFMQGHLDEVEPLAREAFVLGEKARTRNAALFFGTQLAHLMWLQGRFEELEPAITRATAGYRALAANNQAARAAMYAEQGRIDVARAQLEEAAAHDFDDVPRHIAWQTTMALLAECCAVVQEPAHAHRLYALLRPLNGRNLSLPLLMPLGPAAHYLGILATVMGWWEQATRHFEDALGMEARTGTRQHEARTRLAFAAMLMARGESDAARVLLEEASAIAVQLGMTRLGARARELTERLDEGLPRPTDDGPSSTPLQKPREREPRPAANDQPTAVLFRREGEYWTVAQGDAVLRLKNVKGLHYIGHLLRNPGREFHVLELVSVIAGANSSPAASGKRAIENTSPGALEVSGTGALLDRAAKVQYRQRLKALRIQLDEAETFNDSGRAEALRSEVDALTRQLAVAVGLSGRDRDQGSSAERARMTVTKGIKSVVKKIREGNPSLGRHLYAQVHTGHLCSYTPDPDRPIRWVF